MMIIEVNDDTGIASIIINDTIVTSSSSSSIINHQSLILECVMHHPSLVVAAAVAVAVAVAVADTTEHDDAVMQ